MMRLPLLIFACFVSLLVRAAEPDLMAALQVMGYGYKVKVTVNGVDVGVEGGKSEGRRLFNKGHSMGAKATPALRARNFVLVPGTNEFVIEYTKTDPKSRDELEVALEAEGYPQPLLRLVNKGKASNRLVIKVDMAEKAPANFKPAVITE